MDRIPLEVFRLIVSMIEDENVLLCAPDKDRSLSTATGAEASQSITTIQVGSHTYSTSRRSSPIVESTKNMQRRLQNRLATLRKYRPLKLIYKLFASRSTNGDKEDLVVPRITVKRLATLKSLRLCNKKLAVMAAEFLFEEVLLHFTETSQAKFEAISQHPYKDYVRVLQIMPKRISGPLLQKKEFGQWLRGQRTLIDNALVSYAVAYPGLTGPLDMPDGIKITRKAIKFHYEEYSLLYADQQRLFATAEDVLQAAIGRLPQLKRVESGLYWDWSRSRQDIPPNRFEPVSGWRWHFKRNDLSPKNDIIDRVWKTAACQTNFDLDQGAMILRALAHGRTTSGARIDAGPLFRDLSKKALQTADPKVEAAINRLMADTKHLNFYLKSADLDEAQQLLSSGQVLRFLQGMTKIESLRFQSAYQDVEDRVDQGFGDTMTWAHLAYLSIRCVDFLDFGGLASLIHRHRNSLRQLTLFDVYYESEHHCNLFATLQAGELVEVRIWKSDQTAAEQRQPYLDWQANTRPTHVFSGGTWTPRLGSDLRQGFVAKVFPSFSHAQIGLLAKDDGCIQEIGREI